MSTQRVPIIRFLVASMACLVIFVAHAAERSKQRHLIISYAGTGRAGTSANGVVRTELQLANPYGLTRSPKGDLYVCEIDNHLIRRIPINGPASIVAGNGQKGFTGEGGPATAASLNEPYEVRFDPAGNLCFVDMKNNVVQRVDSETGVLSTIAGTGRAGFSGDGGPAVKAQLNQPHSIQFDRAGHLYICDIGNNRIRRVDAKTGMISTLAGTGAKGPTPEGGRFAEVPLNGPRAIDFDRSGHLWLALREGNAVYELNLDSGLLYRRAGTGQKGFTGNGGSALLATLSGPKGLSIGPDDNVYLADTESHSIRMINRKSGTLELIAGTGERGDGPDGNPLLCQFSRPHGIFVDATGQIWVGDSEANRVRLLTPQPIAPQNLQFR